MKKITKVNTTLKKLKKVLEVLEIPDDELNLVFLYINQLYNTISDIITMDSEDINELEYLDTGGGTERAKPVLKKQRNSSGEIREASSLIHLMKNR